MARETGDREEGRRTTKGDGDRAGCI